MRKLDRYIGIGFAQGFLLVVLILVSLFSFLEFVMELDDIGKGNYYLLDAVVYVGLTVPRRVLDMVPMGALLGGIIALGLLADRNELIAMRAAGLSVQRICFSLLLAGAMLMVITSTLEEYVAPEMEQRALLNRSLAQSGEGMLLTERGLWARRGHSFIYVGKTLSGGIAADLDIYEGDESGGLRTFIHASEADVHSDQRWVLKDIRKKIIEEQRIIYKYVGALRQVGQNEDAYVLALWQKLAVPLTTGAMVLLSLPFVFGPPRSTAMGSRITVGAMVGIGFYLANKVVGYVGLLMGLHPALTTLTPVAIILWIALWRLRQAP